MRAPHELGVPHSHDQDVCSARETRKVHILPVIVVHACRNESGEALELARVAHRAGRAAGGDDVEDVAGDAACGLGTRRHDVQAQLLEHRGKEVQEARAIVHLRVGARI